MTPKNPYEVSTSDAPVAGRRLTKTSLLLLVVSLVFYSVAAAFYFFSETWTFYTPYSSEVVWDIPLSGGMGIFFSAQPTPMLLIAFVALGTLCLLFSFAASRKSRRKTS